MRVKQLWNFIPLPAHTKLAWKRITFSKLTTFYFAFSIIHCFIQVGLQIRAFTINADAATFMYDIIRQGKAENDSFPVLNGDLRMCKSVPTGASGDLDSCEVIWDGKPRTNWIGKPGQEAPASVTASPTSTSLATANPSITAAFQQNAAQTPSDDDDDETSSTVTVFVRPTGVPQGSAVNFVVDDDDEDEEDDDDDDEVDLDRREESGFPKIKSFLHDGQSQVIISGMGWSNAPAVLDESCLWSLNYPVTILHNTKREDVTFIAFQFWVLGMSIVALLNESIPHIFASLLTHIMASAWAAYQLTSTTAFRKEFSSVITNGACNGVGSLLPSYWEDRFKAEISGLSLNGLALLLSAFLTWRLVKLFGWQTFKRVGASITINRVYKCVLTLSIIIQLAAFFIAITAILWVDQLYNTNLGRQTDFPALYKATSIAVLAFLLPWLAMGWFAVRRELRIPMFSFLFLGIMYLGSWGVMFFSDTFRWEFLTWRFFAAMSSISVFLTLMSVILGIVCRFNFGKGLPRYLAAQEELPGDDFQPVGPTVGDPEKVSFPSSDKPIPTYSAAFGTRDEVPVPARMFAPRQVGPRFFRSAEPFETESSINSTRSGLSSSPSMHSHSPSYSSQGGQSNQGGNGANLGRMNSNSSGKSFGSIGSYYSYSGRTESDSTGNTMRSDKRFIIE